jgi:hypothetical protein
MDEFIISISFFFSICIVSFGTYKNTEKTELKLKEKRHKKKMINVFFSFLLINTEKENKKIKKF